MKPAVPDVEDLVAFAWKLMFKITEVSFKIFSWLLSIAAIRVLDQLTHDPTIHALGMIAAVWVGGLLTLLGLQFLLGHPRDYGFSGWTVYPAKAIMLIIAVGLIWFLADPVFRLDRALNAIVAANRKS